MIENTINNQTHLFSEVEKSQRIYQPINGKPVVLVVEGNPDNMTTVKALRSYRETFLSHGF